MTLLSMWRRKTWLAIVVLLLPLLAACGGQGDGEDVSWQPVAPIAPIAPISMESSPTTVEPVVRSAASPVADAAATKVPATVEASPHATEPERAASDPSRLSASQLASLQPNELGDIPVIEYHVITTNEADESDQFVRTAEHMREDLEWLYEHDFYVISMRELVYDEISAPAGKHPVVLTFDDATVSQFRWIKGSDGKRVIDPDSAIGVLEAAFAKHPDFGRGGFFAVLPHNCFADDSKFNTLDDCPDKLRWLASNGYEVGNHTEWHQDLFDVTDDEFRAQLAEPILWMRDIVTGPANMMNVVAMPFGDYPSKDLHPEQRDMLYDGFTYDGEHIQIDGALLVGANPTESPSNSEFDPIWIARIQAFEESLDTWFGEFTNGGVILYTSDGNPDTITIPDPVPDSQAEIYDPDFVQRDGRILITYDPDSGKTTRVIRQDLVAWRSEPEL